MGNWIFYDIQHHYLDLCFIENHNASSALFFRIDEKCNQESRQHKPTFYWCCLDNWRSSKNFISLHCHRKKQWHGIITLPIINMTWYALFKNFTDIRLPKRFLAASVGCGELTPSNNLVLLFLPSFTDNTAANNESWWCKFWIIQVSINDPPFIPITSFTAGTSLIPQSPMSI